MGIEIYRNLIEVANNFKAEGMDEGRLQAKVEQLGSALEDYKRTSDEQDLARIAITSNKLRQLLDELNDDSIPRKGNRLPDLM